MPKSITGYSSKIQGQIDCCENKVRKTLKKCGFTMIQPVNPDHGKTNWDGETKTTELWGVNYEPPSVQEKIRTFSRWVDPTLKLTKLETRSA